MKKKLIGLMFAATMLFGASMTVFAADVSPNDLTVSGNEVLEGGTITMDSEVKKAHLEVKITHGTQVIANPYGLVDDTLGLTANETLKGTTIEFENKSNTAISVGLTAKIELAAYAKEVASGDKVTVATSEPDPSKATKKQVFIQAAITDGSGGKLQSSKNADEKALVYSTSGAKMAVVLKAKDDATAGASKTMLMTLTGATTQSPTSEWTEKDAFKVLTSYDLQFGTTPSTFK